MANLQKIIKVTQAQYDILASGGTVGDYTGLDPNYIYLVVDDTEYLPTSGGAITNNNDVPLDIHYDNNNSYFLRVYPNPSDNSTMYTFEVEDNETGSEIELSLPASGGILALRNDINNGKLNIKNGSTTLATFTANQRTTTDLDLSNTYVTLGTAQTISGAKTFSDNIIISNTSKKITFNDSSNPASIGYAAGGYITTTNLRAGNYVIPYGNTGSGSIGISTIRWGNYYGVNSNLLGNLTLAGNLTDGTNSITVANIQEKVQVKRYI